MTVRAEAGPHWAEATVTLVSTSWDMGNGDVVTCDGPGVAIVDIDDPSEGPCGYTYRIVVAGRRTVPAVGHRNVGGDVPVVRPVGSAGSIDRTLSVAYDVDEIQTVGISNSIPDPALVPQFSAE